MSEKLTETIINCENCNEPFETLLVVKDGQPYDYCCSINVIMNITL